jgi:hypothetical protein
LSVDNTQTPFKMKWEDFSSALGLPDKTNHALEVLTVNEDEDEIEWRSALPDKIGSGEKYLVNNNSDIVEWTEIKQLPAYTSNYAVLTLSNGTVYWSEPNALPNQSPPQDVDGYVLTSTGGMPQWTDMTDLVWIKEDTTWTIGSGQDYATISAAFAALDDYYLLPKATLTLQLTTGDHYIEAPGITISNRGRGEGRIVLKGGSSTSSHTVITSSDFGSYDTDQPMIELYESALYVENLTFNGATQTGQSAIGVVGNGVVVLTNVVVSSFINGLGFNGNALGVLTSCQISSCSKAGLSIGDSTVTCYSCTFIANNQAIFLNRGSISVVTSTITLSTAGDSGFVLRNGSKALFCNTASIVSSNSSNFLIDCQDHSHFIGWQPNQSGGVDSSTYGNTGKIYAATMSSINIKNTTVHLSLNLYAQRMSLIYQPNGVVNDTGTDTSSLVTTT